MVEPLQFSECEDGRVAVGRSGGGPRCRMRREDALQLFLAGAPTTGDGPVVVLALLPSPAMADGGCVGHLWISASTEPVAPRWPDWSGRPPPVPRPLTVGRWYSLPHLQSNADETAPLIQNQERSQRERESQRSQDIADRCRKIQQDAECPEFCETLDYYTTLRVKSAYQRMNMDGIGQRLAEVRRRWNDVVDRLRFAPQEMVQTYEPPAAALTCEQENADPNRMCVPESEDFALPDVS